MHADCFPAFSFYLLLAALHLNSPFLRRYLAVCSMVLECLNPITQHKHPLSLSLAPSKWWAPWCDSFSKHSLFFCRASFPLFCCASPPPSLPTFTRFFCNARVLHFRTIHPNVLCARKCSIACFSFHFVIHATCKLNENPPLFRCIKKVFVGAKRA